MIAIPSQSIARPGLQPYDTGCVFPHGVNGEDVRVRLVTDNPVKAQACGEQLHKWGLPRIREIIATRNHVGLIALDLKARPEIDETGAVVPRKIKFGGDVLILETTNPDNLVRFAAWFDEHARREVHYRKEKPPSLNQLAEDGEIETIDGD